MQHEQGVLTRLGKAIQLRGYQKAEALIADLGEANNDTTTIYTSVDDFYKKSPASVTVGDTVVPLGPDTPPLPGELARQLLADPAGLSKRVERQLKLIQNAPAREVERLYRELRAMVNEFVKEVSR